MVFSFPGTFLLDIKSIKRVVLEGENSAYRNMPALSEEDAQCPKIEKNAQNRFLCTIKNVEMTIV